MDSSASHRMCDHPGCSEVGVHRAPQGRECLDSYYWFCLDHVRAYNRSWNYCAGMSTDQIESNIRQDAVWRRPTWRFGTGGRRIWTEDDIDDPLGFMGSRQRPRRWSAPEGENSPERRYWSPASPEGRALVLLGLAADVTLASLKARYKELAKKHHPDTNGGCKLAEERLKSINEAYKILRQTITA